MMILRNESMKIKMQFRQDRIVKVAGCLYLANADLFHFIARRRETVWPTVIELPVLVFTQGRVVSRVPDSLALRRESGQIAYYVSCKLAKKSLAC